MSAALVGGGVWGGDHTKFHMVEKPRLSSVILFQRRESCVFGWNQGLEPFYLKKKKHKYKNLKSQS